VVVSAAHRAQIAVCTHDFSCRSNVVDGMVCTRCSALESAWLHGEVARLQARVAKLEAVAEAARAVSSTAAQFAGDVGLLYEEAALWDDIESVDGALCALDAKPGMAIEGEPVCATCGVPAGIHDDEGPHPFALSAKHEGAK
jgi:hypothetical protein